ncbi:MAG: hypothetical protein WCW33_01985 [Candidatus Babeliales bacterium]
MTSLIVLSLAIGCILGALYALFFIRRMRAHFVVDTSARSTGAVWLVVSFFGGLALITVTFGFCIHTMSISMMWSSCAFMTSFWIIVWRYTKNLL